MEEAGDPGEITAVPDVTERRPVFVEHLTGTSVLVLVRSMAHGG